MANDSRPPVPVPALDLARQCWAAAALDLARAEGRGDDATSEDARVACVVFDGLAAAGLLPEQFSRDALLELGPFMVDEDRSPHWLTAEDYWRVDSYAPDPPSRDDQVHPDGLRCPRCRSTNVVCHGRPHGHGCRDCGYDGTTQPDLAPAARREIAEGLRSEAEIAARPGQFDRLNALADRLCPESPASPLPHPEGEQ
jgi:hypothetical protein